MRRATTLCLAAGLLGTVAAALLTPKSPAQADEALPVIRAPAHRLQATRLLRRISLVLLNRAPTPEEYQELLAVPEADQPAYLAGRVDELLDSEAFGDVVLRWGIETLRTVSYDFAFDFVNGRSYADYAVLLEQCPEGSLHAGALGKLNYFPLQGEPWTLCDDPNAPIHDVEPWWAPGTSVRAIGVTGADIREVDGVDCGTAVDRGYSTSWSAPGCSCGPNLIYCKTVESVRNDSSNRLADSTRRQAFEEPARLYRHIIMEDRPFSDVVLGDYTLATRGLYYAYRRSARRNSANAALDDDPWFRTFDNDTQWRQVPFAEMHPNLLADRNYTFDPRSQAGSPEGVPSAGVMTTLAANSSFARERVRAARWLEIFACRVFSPPPADAVFVPYVNDPGTEGSCQQCHQLIDPAAMHFKRMHGGGAELGGVGTWSLRQLDQRNTFRERSALTFEPDTLMTPVDALTLETNPDAGLIDFMPDDYSLFGEKSDGTIGPLGFGKLLVNSGEFDECAVRTFHERVTGVELVRGRDDAKIQSLVQVFIQEDRRVKALIRHIMTSPEFGLGW